MTVITTMRALRANRRTCALLTTIALALLSGGSAKAMEEGFEPIPFRARNFLAIL